MESKSKLTPSQTYPETWSLVLWPRVWSERLTLLPWFSWGSWGNSCNMQWDFTSLSPQSTWQHDVVKASGYKLIHQLVIPLAISDMSFILFQRIIVQNIYDTIGQKHVSFQQLQPWWLCCTWGVVTMSSTSAGRRAAVADQGTSRWSDEPVHRSSSNSLVQVRMGNQTECNINQVHVLQSD